MACAGNDTPWCRNASSTPPNSSAAPTQASAGGHGAAQRERVGEGRERLEHDQPPRHARWQALACLVPAQGAQPGGEEADGEHQREERLRPRSEGHREVEPASGMRRARTRRTSPARAAAWRALRSRPRAGLRLACARSQSALRSGYHVQHATAPMASSTPSACCRTSTKATAAISAWFTHAMPAAIIASARRTSRRQATSHRRAALAVRGDGDHHRQRADDHRGSDRHHDRRGEEDVVKEVADRGELQRLDPVGARQARKLRAVQPGERQRDQPERQVAPGRQQDGGILGSHLCERLLAGHDVLCVDNFFTGRKPTSRTCSTQPGFELMRHDVTFPLYVEVDEIYNLACPASPIHYQFDPVQTTKTSVHGAINMLGLAKRLQARSCRPRPARSTATRRASADRGLLGQRQPDRPALLLRRGQALRRDAVLRLPPPARLDIKVARIFNTYGPRMHLRTTAAWCRTSSCRRCGASRSPSTATAARRARSATSTT